MTLSETALADLDAATNQVAAELDTLRGELTTADSAVADKIAAAANRLRGLAADPTNPVPAPAPAPEPAPAEPAPAPGA
jgi:F420-0:gamma-glutamyl ligase